MISVPLTAGLVESFAGAYLSGRYDDPKPTPPFHRECWELYCRPEPLCEVIAPRDHAKSTALTFDYTLAEICFRNSDYAIIVGSTEDMAAEQLSNLREELLDNEDLRADFGIGSFEQDSKTDIIVRCTDGHRFRILARGAEQKIRGKMWKGKRPNLIVCDDMEDDEQVLNKDRRAKFRAWFFRAALQAVSQYGKVRVHGTILHEDSLLARLRKAHLESLRKGEKPSWQILYYKAHRSFDDFSDLLWPQRWSAEKLRARRQSFLDDGDAPGYAQEYLNEPSDTANPFLRREDFLPMTVPDDHDRPKIMGCGVDFAFSKKEKANRTSFTVGGKCPDNLIHIVDQRVGRMNSLEVMDEMFSVQEAWNIDVWWVEGGQIWGTIEPMIYKEMQLRDRFLNIVVRQAVSDKAVRARPFQRRHRARCMRFDKLAEWYPGYEDELLKFRVESEATLDDQFDSTAHLVAGFEAMADVAKDDFDTDDERDFEAESRRLQSHRPSGRSLTTGY